MSSDRAFLATVCLNGLGVIGPVLYDRLIARFGSSEAALDASRNDLMTVEGIGEKTADAVFRAGLSDAEKELETARKNGVTILSRENFPPGLRVLDGPPVLLYVKGTIAETDAIAVAVVGSRRCTVYGRNQAERIGFRLSERGVTVVSGMARGIDTAAHSGALQGPGRTIAVLGSGLSNIYPAENRKLFSRIAEKGAVVSEFPMWMKPLSGNFPRRNRIISALSLGVVVVEAAKASGSLITASWAAEQGKDVFAFPGKAGSATSRGTHSLIKTGAKLVEDVDDILEELGELGDMLRSVPAVEDDTAEGSGPGGFERAVLNVLSEDEPVCIEDVIEKTELEPNEVSGVLTRLELKGIIEALPGKAFVRKQVL